MKTRLADLYERLRTSFWFVPSVLVAIAFALAIGLVELDRVVLTSKTPIPGWLYTGSPEGARSMLSAIASSTITVAGTTFSITIAALTLASQQFGPRLLRNFMRDTGNQVVLGTFIATFAYCLLVLRTVRGVEDREFVPQIAVTGGIALAMASLAVLIYFIHHVASSIQVSNIIAEVGHEVESAIDRLYPTMLGSGSHPAIQPPLDLHSGTWVMARDSGYVQGIDTDGLFHTAEKCDLVVRVIHRPGDFVVADQPLAEVWPSSNNHDNHDELADRINQAFIIGSGRTQTQDLQFSVDQLVEIGVRALSPGTNDPFTAINCIDRLSAALCRLARREIPSRYRYDDHGALRVIADPLQFEIVAATAIHRLRQYGHEHVSVVLRLLHMLDVVGRCVADHQQRALLLRHADLIMEDVPDSLASADRNEIEERYQAVRHSLLTSDAITV